MDNADFRWRKIIIPAFGPTMLFGISNGAVLPVIALTAIDLNASHAVSGLIVALVGLGSLIGNIPAALITGRFGERRSLIGASVLSVIAIILCLLARRPATLAVGVLMLGLATSVFYLARQSYMIDAVPVRLRARAFSTLGGTQRIGMLVGPFAAAAFMHFMGLPGAYWMAIIALCATGVVSFMIPELQIPASRSDPAAATPESSNTSTGGTTQNLLDASITAQVSPKPSGTAESGKKAKKRKEAASPEKLGLWAVGRAHYRVLISLGSGVMLIGAMRASRQVAIPLWAAHIGLSPTVTAVIFGLMSAIDVLVFYPAGKVMDEYGRLWVALPCTLILGLSFIIMPFTTTLFPFVVLCMFMGLGNGIGSGIVMILGADSAPAQGRTQFLGLWRLFADVGSSSGPFFLSAMTALISLSAGIVAIGTLGFASATIFWRSLPHSRQKPASKQGNSSDTPSAATEARPLPPDTQPTDTKTDTGPGAGRD